MGRGTEDETNSRENNHKSATILIASDLDGTLIPPPDHDSGPDEISMFRRLVRRQEGVALAYVTGRHLELALEGIHDQGLPRPDILVCDVGTTVYQRMGNEWLLDEAYRERISEPWDGKTAAQIAALLGDLPGATPQGPGRQQEFKQSYTVDLPSDLTRLESFILDKLRVAQLSARVICSVDPVRKVGLLDLLPPRAAKDSALEYLQKSMGISESRMVFAGDSGNDILGLTSGHQAILVGNATEDVRTEVRRIAAERQLEASVYFAKAKYAAGVIEGCRHFGLLRKGL